MNGEELRTEFRALVDDENIDSAQELRWINQAYDFINVERIWNFLRKEDTSQTVVNGTAAYSLPSDFVYPAEDHFFITNAAGLVIAEIKFVPMKDRLKYNNRQGYAYVDLANSNLVFTTDDLSAYSGGTINLPYQYQPDQLTDATTPVFNRAFHILLSFEAAKMFWYNDQQEKDRSFNREMQAEYNRVRKGMVRWDAHLDRALSGSAQPLENWAPGVS